MKYRRDGNAVVDDDGTVANCSTPDEAQEVVDRLNDLYELAYPAAERDDTLGWGPRPGLLLPTDARHQLLAAMHELSERHWCVSWFTDTADKLWAACYEGDRSTWGYRHLDYTDIARLKDLAAQAGGWWSDPNHFVTLQQFKAHRASR